MAGDCVNVEPGTYTAGATIAHGGSSATSSGYVVYRCTTMDACTITNPNLGLGVHSAGTGPSHVIFDGFAMRATSEATYGAGYELYNSNCPGSACANIGSHYWILNSIISGYGQSGFSGCCADFVYVLHNTFYNNASAAGCDGGAQGSGISMWQPAASSITDAQLTEDDKNNSVTGNMAVNQGGLGSTWFRQVYEWNITYNNHMTGCGSGEATDGNGIIMDTFNGDQGGGIGTYQHMTLVAFNVTYNNGGAGIELFDGGNFVIANNSAYNSYLDTTNTGTWRGTINCNVCYNVLMINNISTAVTGSGVLSNNNDYLIDCSGTSQTGNCTLTDNIGYCVGANCSNQDRSLNPNGGTKATWTAGQDSVNPVWVDVGKTSTGAYSTPPVGANFALQSTSTAIGYGLTETYLPAQSVDVGACAHALATCP